MDLSLNISNLKDHQLNTFDYRSEVYCKLTNNLIDQFNKVFIEGLKLKGFQFATDQELEDFIKIRCRCEDNVEFKERVYYVDNIPFLLHNYKSEVITDPRLTGDSHVVTASYGDYAYL